MTKHEHFSLAGPILAAMLWLALADDVDPTLAPVRWPLVLLASVGLTWLVWSWSGSVNASYMRLTSK